MMWVDFIEWFTPWFREWFVDPPHYGLEITWGLGILCLATVLIRWGHRKRQDDARWVEIGQKVDILGLNLTGLPVKCPRHDDDRELVRGDDGVITCQERREPELSGD